MSSFLAYMDHKLKVAYGISDKSTRKFMLSKLSENYYCPFCPKKLNITNTQDTAVHHCHLCGLMVDVMCRGCNALEDKKSSFRNRYIFGFGIRAKESYPPYIYELGNCAECNAD